MPSTQSYDVAPQSRVIPGAKNFTKPISAHGEAFIRKLKAKHAKKKVPA
jgi:hypothetical protein